VILPYDIHAQTVKALPANFNGLLEKHHTFTTITSYLGTLYPVAQRL